MRTDIAADREITDLSPIDATMCLKQAVRWRKWKRATFGASMLCLVLAFAGGPVILNVLPWQAVNWFFDIVFGYLLPASLIGIIVAVVMRPSRKNPLHNIWLSKNPETVGAQLEATRMLLPNLKVKAIQSLVDVLPLVSETQAVNLTQYQLNCLVRMLEVVEQPHLHVYNMDVAPEAYLTDPRFKIVHDAEIRRNVVLAVLRIVGWCGSDRELRSIKPLAGGHGPAENDIAIREAAVQCVEVVTARMKRNTYLRPAKPIGAETDDLLRPVDRSRVSSERLLRPMDDIE